MTLTAGDVAQTNVATLAPEASLVNAHRLFVDEQISGAPVVEDSGAVVGVVSSSDLLRSIAESQDSGGSQPTYLRELLTFSGPDWYNLPNDLQDRLDSVVVGDVMTPSPATVEAEATVVEVARLMRDARIHRVIVVKEGYLVGIISSLDLAGLIAEGRVEV
jgi:CBS domain-containing protein